MNREPEAFQNGGSDPSASFSRLLPYTHCGYDLPSGYRRELSRGGPPTHAARLRSPARPVASEVYRPDSSPADAGGLYPADRLCLWRCPPPGHAVRDVDPAGHLPG